MAICAMTSGLPPVTLARYLRSVEAIHWSPYQGPNQRIRGRRAMRPSSRFVVPLAAL